MAVATAQTAVVAVEDLRWERRAMAMALGGTWVVAVAVKTVDLAVVVGTAGLVAHSSLCLRRNQYSHHCHTSSRYTSRHTSSLRRRFPDSPG